MTLIIAAGNDKSICLVSDRRYSSANGFFDDEQSKSTILTCQDARIAVGFSGLAVNENFRTEQWIVNALLESAELDPTMWPILSRFEQIATRDFAKIKLHPKHKRLSLLFAGYHYSETPPRAHYWRISNCEQNGGKQLDEARPEFQTCWGREQRPPREAGVPAFVMLIGNTAGVDRVEQERLQELLSLDIPVSAIVNKSVDLIRGAADAPRSSGSIGKQCLSVVVPADKNFDVTSGYHSATLAYSTYMSNIVLADSSRRSAVTGIKFEAVEATSPEHAVAYPKVGRNVPCPCKSGKKFKHCHGRSLPAMSRWN